VASVFGPAQAGHPVECSVQNIIGVEYGVRVEFLNIMLALHFLP